MRPDGNVKRETSDVCKEKGAIERSTFGREGKRRRKGVGKQNGNEEVTGQGVEI